MEDASNINWDEKILPFELRVSDCRGRVVRLDQTVNDILSQHNYPKQVESLISEMVIITALLGSMVEPKWKLSLQVQTDGPVRMIATDYFAPAEVDAPASIRAYASYDGARITNGKPFDQLGKGYFAVIIDQGKGATPYKALSGLDGSSIAEAAEGYFAASEQIATKLIVEHGETYMKDTGTQWRAAGMLLQHLPKSLKSEGGDPENEKEQRDHAQRKDEDWNRVNILLNTVEGLELLGPYVSPPELVWRLFNEEEPAVYEPKDVQFGCTCSEERVRQSLSIYGVKDIEKMTTEDGKVTADCQFCNRHFELDPATVGLAAK
ncbi:Hsp33 family molecular chaperone HslO [Lentibacter sp. XHP0401]|uniref:Hsp33 family molecular chaperone HslO n=1 Tax=Lentibacter sp. XHP0401 TaxID=2984334 RepID=UPI0021E98581|nr:Hsp33 family molecular chaperone HslO [Lentibacter sp. XHP0401]MCV2892523.1 Hsp33 family molecular chaperone HslO [Lentibacter sp. XHP0401]